MRERVNLVAGELRSIVSGPKVDAAVRKAVPFGENELARG